MKKTKTPEVRAREVDQIRKKLLDLGFSPEDGGVARMFEALDRFASDGIGQSGHIDSDVGYRFIFKLSTTPHVTSDMVVRKLIR